MRYLTKEYWANFKKDGHLFEELSKALIYYEYNIEDFIVVGGPNDGGKDIYLKISLLDSYTTEVWAQCKYHKKSLSFSDISYTLLMAYIKNTNQVLIFSYSKGSKEFLKNLDEYRERTGKSVILYDDEQLEQLILKHKEKLIRDHEEFFPKFPQATETSSAWLDCTYRVFINEHYADEKRISINLNTIIKIVLVITNKTAKTQTIKLDLARNRTNKAFEVINEGCLHNYTIEKYSTITVDIFTRLNKYITTSSLPSFIITSTIDKTIYVKTTKRIDCRWLAETVLIGDSYYEAIETINSIIRLPCFHLAYIYGESGIGKSRVLKEAQKQAIKSNKKTIYIDSDKKTVSCKRFLEYLCSAITELPFWGSKVKFISNTNDDFFDFATRILYDDTYDVEKNLQEIIRFLSFAMSSNSYVLVLDNLQHFDNLSLQVIELLTQYLINSNSRTIILLGINTDYVYPNSAFDAFYFRLKMSATNSFNYTSISLSGFSSEDTEAFIRECLTFEASDTSCSLISYNKAIKKMAILCGHNPFFIQQYLLYLYQMRIIERGINTLFYFRRLSLFLRSFNEIPQTVNDLIREREMLMVSTLSDTMKDGYRLLVYLFIICKSIPLDLYYEIIDEKNLLNLVQDLGFFSVVNNEIVAFHSYNSLYYSNQYSTSEIKTPFLSQFISAVEKLELISDLALPYYWAKSKVIGMTYDETVNVCKMIKSKNIDCHTFLFSLKEINKAIEKHFNALLPSDYYTIYSSLCSMIDETCGLQQSNYFYNKFINTFISKYVLFNVCTEKCVQLITNHLIHLINQELYDDCISIVNQITSISNQFFYVQKIETEYQMNRCLIMIYNRSNIVDRAIRLASRNLEILDDSNIDGFFKNRYLFSALRSIGNTYFYSTIASQKKSEIVRSWRTSFDSYVKSNGFNVECDFNCQPKVAAYAKGLAAEIIAENEEGADSIVKFFINAFDKMDMAYYEMQIRLLYAIYLTWKWSASFEYANKLNIINRVTDSAIDISTVYGRVLTTINAFHLKGCIYFLANDFLKSAEYYCIAADLLANYIKSDRDFERWNYFWVDLARSIKKSCSKKHFLKLDDRIKNKVSYILDMNSTDFDCYESSYSPITAITDQNYSINFPKI